MKGIKRKEIDEGKEKRRKGMRWRESRRENGGKTEREKEEIM